MLAYFGHHKTGTEWIWKHILSEVCLCLDLKWKNIHCAMQVEDPMETDFLFYTNADYAVIKEMNFKRAFHVIRDPRDLAVSAYFSHCHSHSTDGWPELLEHRKKLESLPQSEGLLLDMEFTDALPWRGTTMPVFQHIAEWNFKDPRILEVKFENLTQNTHEEFVRITKFLEILDDNHFLASLRRSFLPFLKVPMKCLPEHLLRDILIKKSFEALSKGRGQGDENVKSHYRKGVRGEWKKYFEEEHKKYFKQKYPNLLVKLGYEENEAW